MLQRDVNSLLDLTHRMALLADLVEFADEHIGCAIAGIRARLKSGQPEDVLVILEMLDVNRQALLRKVRSNDIKPLVKIP